MGFSGYDAVMKLFHPESATDIFKKSQSSLTTDVLYFNKTSRQAIIPFIFISTEYDNETPGEYK